MSDDGMNVVYADSIEECNALLQAVALDLANWYDLVGLSLNVKKVKSWASVSPQTLLF